MRMTFEAGMGAEAIKKLLAEIDLEKLSEELQATSWNMPPARSASALLKRLEVRRGIPPVRQPAPSG